jgi:N-carbamoylputrescine amidase
MTRCASKVKIAGIQMSCEIGNEERNIDKAVGMIDEAAQNGCQIICLPEMFKTDYVCFTRRDAKCLEYAEPVPGPTTDKIAKRAEEHGVYIIASIFEKGAPGLYYNTAALIGPDGGIVGKYRKTHIPAPFPSTTGLEKLYFRPGDEFNIFETKLGKIGIIICHDGVYPETWRILALEGAEMIFRPSCVSVAYRTKHITPSELWIMNHVTYARENAVFVLAVNRVGLEEGRQHFGTTMIVDPCGDVLAKAGESEEKIVSAVLDLNEVGMDGTIFRDYRPEIYGRITKPPKG